MTKSALDVCNIAFARVRSMDRLAYNNNKEIGIVTMSSDTVNSIQTAYHFDPENYKDGAIRSFVFSIYPIKINNNLKLGAVGCEYEN